MIQQVKELDKGGQVVEAGVVEMILDDHLAEEEQALQHRNQKPKRRPRQRVLEEE